MVHVSIRLKIDVPLMTRHEKLSTLLVDGASLTQVGTYNLILKALEDLYIKVREINSGQEVPCLSEHQSEGKGMWEKTALIKRKQYFQ